MGEVKPILSVVMSVYNGEQYLAEAIESILAQTYDRFELIIVNDGSTDASLEIIRTFAEQDRRIRVIDQANTGLTVALVRGVSASRGEFIARMDADDLSLPTRFEKQMALFDDEGDVVAVTCHVEHFSDDEGVLHTAQLNFDPRLVPLYNCFCNIIGGHGQIIFRRSAYDAAGGYDPERRFAQDYDLWTRLTEHGCFAEVEEALYKFRTGHDSISKVNRGGQAESSTTTCQREFEKLTGAKLPRSSAYALRHFWWNTDPRDIPVIEVRSISKAMDRAVRSFFASHRDLKREEYGVRIQIARMFARRSERLGLRSVIRKLAFAAQWSSWTRLAERAHEAHNDLD